MARATATISVMGIPKVRELVALVRAVAKCEPMAYCPGDEMSGDWYTCGFCDVQTDATSRYGEWKPVEHHESCEWRRVREWVDAQ